MLAGIWCAIDSLLFRQRNPHIHNSWHNLTFHAVNNGDMQGVTSVELDKKELSMVEEDEVTLKATVKPDDATDKTVSWKSSNQEIVTVDDSGKVKAIKA